jgi:hypothetical protein
MNIKLTKFHVKVDEKLTPPFQYVQSTTYFCYNENTLNLKHGNQCPFFSFTMYFYTSILH